MALELNGTTGVSLVQDGLITDANLPAGSVLQVVAFTTSTNIGTTSTSPVATNVEATITPTSTSSKILVQVHLNGVNGPNALRYANFWLYKNDVLLQSLQQGVARNLDLRHEGCSNSYLDSPSSTSALKYTV